MITAKLAWRVVGGDVYVLLITRSHQLLGSPFILKIHLLFSLVVKRKTKQSSLQRLGATWTGFNSGSAEFTSSEQIPSCCPRAGVIPSTSDWDNTVPHRFMILVYPFVGDNLWHLVSGEEVSKVWQFDPNPTLEGECLPVCQSYSTVPLNNPWWLSPSLAWSNIISRPQSLLLLSEWYDSFH